MRGLKVIGLFCVLVFLAACTSCHNDPVETRLIASPTTIASSELISIDSLMWQQPDSALMRLLPCFDTCCRDGVHTVSTAYNCHYAHLLLAELLYKNDYAQTNRAELQQAVSYFDSLVRQAFPPFKGVPEGRGIHTNNSNDILSFLDARAHYINGVGYYENDSAVEACAEYLKALEIMDERFGEKELVGKKAKFMAYTYNRLGDLFSEQFMMEPAIACYKNSYAYSIVSPISSYSVSNALYHMGLQFNMKGEKDSANYYYSQALANMPDSTNPYYRDIVSTQYLLLYQLTHQTEASLKRLKQMVALTEDDDERLTRYLAIGDIYFEEGFYDSACFYLEPVLKNNDNSFLQIQVANYLRIIYDSLGNKEKSDWCKLYLALHNETGAENSALVSQLSDLFKTYMSQRQEKEAEAKREAAVKKVLKVIIPIAVVLTLAIIVTAKWRSKKLLKAKEERHQQEMETERQAHKMQQAALSGRLKRSNEELRDVSKQLEQSLSKNTFESEASNDYAAFINAPICLYIVELAHKSQFKSKMDYLIYKDDALSKEQILALRDAAEKHLARFVSLIRKQFPKLTDSDMDYCYLFLLGLSEADISALMQRAYTTVCDRSRKINRIVGADDSLYHTLHNML